MIATESLIIGMAALVGGCAAAGALRLARAAAGNCWAVGIAAGFWTGHLVLARHSGLGTAVEALLQPREARNWLPLLVLLALCTSLLARHVPRAWCIPTATIAALVVLAVPARLLAGHLARSWAAWEKSCWLALVALVLAALWFQLASVRSDDQPCMRGLLAVIVCAAAAAVIGLSGSIVYAQLAASVAAAVLGAMLAAAPRYAGLEAAAGVLTCSLGGLVLLSCFYARLEIVDAGLLFVALGLAGGKLPEFLRRQPAWTNAGIRVVGCLVPLCFALWRAAA